MAKSIEQLEREVEATERDLKALEAVCSDLTDPIIVSALSDLDRILPAAGLILLAQVDPTDSRTGQATRCAVGMQGHLRHFREEWQTLRVLLQQALIPKAVNALGDAQAKLKKAQEVELQPA